MEFPFVQCPPGTNSNSQGSHVLLEIYTTNSKVTYTLFTLLITYTHQIFFIGHSLVSFTELPFFKETNLPILSTQSYEFSQVYTLKEAVP